MTALFNFLLHTVSHALSTPMGSSRASHAQVQTDLGVKYTHMKTALLMK